jgi:serine/threonine protein kinase/tetratricopeptide (TPR) repeat protein
MSQVTSLPKLFGRRYQPGELLGQGGMGAVYRAVDRLTGQTIALKRVISLVDNQDAQSQSDSVSYRLALAKEFKILASLRHPNIINVLDYGFDEEQQPYITMELLQDAQTLLDATANQSLEQRINFIIELLQALAYLHRRGILHRDLKPSNVLVNNKEELKVLDFGLAVEPEHAKDMAGTIAYMAPEVLQGRQATRGVDLYAVGVMAYEMFTGSHPFDTENLQKLVWDVLNSVPDLTVLTDITPKPIPISKSHPEIQGSDHKTIVGGESFNKITEDQTVDPYEIDDFETVTQLPKTIDLQQPHAITEGFVKQDAFVISDASALEEATLSLIIGKLLSKTPEQRYQNSYDVIVDLANAIGIPVPQESSAILESFLQAATFVGREIELKQLEDALAAAVQGQGSAWLISGESGVGKSRLLEELRIRALSQGVMVIRGQAVSDGGIPYQLWREPLRRIVLTTDVDALDTSILKEVIPDISSLLDKPVADAMLLEGIAQQQRLLGSIANLFQKQTQPIMLILEDLQWSNESLEILKLLNGMVDRLPILIVGNYRHEERPLLPNELPGMQVLRLERLSAENIMSLSESMLGEAGRLPAIVELLKRETEGNVFFLVEVVRALAEAAGGLSLVGRMSLPENVLAGGIQTIIQRRLEHVPEWGRLLLQLAAIYGRELDTSILKTVKGTVDFEEWLMTCINSAVFEVQDGQYRFAHDKLREAALNSIPTETRPKLHRRIAQAIEHVYPDSPEQATVLVQHWHAAGDQINEFRCVQLAGDYALRISAFSDAAHHFERGLELLSILMREGVDQHQMKANLLIKLGEAFLYLGDYARANDYTSQALELYRLISDGMGTARALSLRGDINWRSGDYTAATEACLESLELYRGFGDERGIARVLNRLGMVSFDQGDYVRADDQIKEALRVAESIEDRAARSMSMNNLGLVALRQGNYVDATEYFKETLGISRESGERWKVASALYNLGTLAGIQGNLSLANDYFEQSLNMCRSIGDRRGIGLALENIGFVAQLQGDFAKATQHLAESLSIARAIGNRQGSANTLVNLGHLSTAQGEAAQAVSCYLESLQVAREIKAVPLMLEAICGLARLESEPVNALMWLGVVIGHPSASQETRDLVEQVLSQLRETHSSEEIDAGIARAQGVSLDSVVEQLLQQ